MYLKHLYYKNSKKRKLRDLPKFLDLTIAMIKEKINIFPSFHSIPFPSHILRYSILIFMVLVLPATDLLSQNHGKSDYIVSYGPFVHINWTTGKMYSLGETSFSQIEEERIREKGRKASPLLRSKLRSRARHLSIREAQERLLSTLENLPFDSHSLVKDRIKQNSELAKSIKKLGSRIQVDKIQTKKDRIKVRVLLSFYGKKGLYQLFQDTHRAPEYMPHIPNKKQGTYPITGLILSLEELKGFEPSLHPKLYSKQGVLIYEGKKVQKNCRLNQGIIKYSTSLKAAYKEKRVGRKPYLAMVNSLKGSSDLILGNRDVTKILSSPSALAALKQCRVVLIPSAPKKKKAHQKGAKSRDKIKASLS